MSNNKYSLRYLPFFYDDLNEKVQYITFEKKNPEAASRLIDAVENAIMEVRRLLYKRQDRDIIV